MNGVRGPEPERGDVKTLQNIQHLRDVHAGRRGRRRPEDFPAAIIGADRRALDGLVGRQILARDKAAMGLHVVGEDIAERPVIQRLLAVLRYIGQRLRIFRLHHPFAGFERCAVGQIDRRDRLVLAHLFGAVGDALVQIGRRRIAARGVPDRGLHDIGKTHGAEPVQRLAPGFQRARGRDRLRAVEVFIVDGVEHIMRRTGFRSIGVGPDRQRNGALAIDETMAAVGQTDMRHAAADDSDHHRLDHGQREQGRDRRIDGIAAGGEHLGARGRRQRMIADHHAAAARCRLLLTLENRARAIAPVVGHGRSSLVISWLAGMQGSAHTVDSYTLHVS